MPMRHEITADELKRLHERGADFFLVDVREGEEQERGTIPGSLRIPLDDLDRAMEGIPKDKPLVLYCRRGPRSLRGCMVLRDKGFSDVRMLRGGYEEWQTMGR